jgi:hypothetical protein
MGVDSSVSGQSSVLLSLSGTNLDADIKKSVPDFQATAQRL